jgi:hypothetical protein
MTEYNGQNLGQGTGVLGMGNLPNVIRGPPPSVIRGPQNAVGPQENGSLWSRIQHIIGQLHQPSLPGQPGLTGLFGQQTVQPGQQVRPAGPQCQQGMQAQTQPPQMQQWQNQNQNQNQSQNQGYVVNGKPTIVIRPTTGGMFKPAVVRPVWS